MQGSTSPAVACAGMQQRSISLATLIKVIIVSHVASLCHYHYFKPRSLQPITTASLQQLFDNDYDGAVVFVESSILFNIT